MFLAKANEKTSMNMPTLKKRTQNTPIAFVITWLLVTFISMILTLSLNA